MLYWGRVTWMTTYQYVFDGSRAVVDGLNQPTSLGRSAAAEPMLGRAYIS